MELSPSVFQKISKVSKWLNFFVGSLIWLGVLVHTVSIALTCTDKCILDNNNTWFFVGILLFYILEMLHIWLYLWQKNLKNAGQREKFYLFNIGKIGIGVCFLILAIWHSQFRYISTPNEVLEPESTLASLTFLIAGISTFTLLFTKKIWDVTNFFFKSRILFFLGLLLTALINTFWAEFYFLIFSLGFIWVEIRNS